MSDFDNIYKPYAKNVIASIAVFAAISVASYAYYLSVVPQTYDECVIQSVPNISDKTLAKVVIDSCLNKFSQDAIQLLPNDISGLTGFGSAKKSAYSDKNDDFSAELYNGNENTYINRVVIGVGSSTDIKNYSVNVNLPPYSKTYVTFHILPVSDTDKGEWVITKAFGSVKNKQ